MSMSFACALLISSTASSATLLDGFVRWEESEGGNGRFYGVVVEDVSWGTAQADAPTINPSAELVTITSAAEQAFVENVLQMSLAPTGGYWIGLREEGEGNYVWDNGEPVTYTHWFPGEPSNGGGVEDRAHIFWTSDADSDNDFYSVRGTWNDAAAAGVDPPAIRPESITVGYVIEAPEPTAFVLTALAFIACAFTMRHRPAISLRQRITAS